MRSVQFLIMTGMSGSGKSYVQDCFEDMGYFCVDNLPLGLLEKFCQLSTETGGEINRVAVVLDVRDRSFATNFLKHLEELRERYSFRLLFLEASDEVLMRRFSETRRPHPLAGHGPLKQALELERQLLAEVRGVADFVVDTSEFSVHDLREQIRKKFAPEKRREGLVVSVVSFGFKYGIPYNSDLVFDVRFLPNPYFVTELKHRTGLDGPVVDFVRRSPEASEFIARLRDFMEYLMPRYVHEGKSYLTISIGCTGGKHRSVVVANELAASLRSPRENVTVEHRDVNRP